MQRICLNKDWFCLPGAGGFSAAGVKMPKGAVAVDLPHDAAFSAPRLAVNNPENGFYSAGTVTYFKEFTLGTKPEKVMIEVEGTAGACALYINGAPVRSSISGRAPFAVDITPQAKQGTNVIKAQITAPEGYSAFYSGLGITRGVYLLTSGSVYVAPRGLSAAAAYIQENGAGGFTAGVSVKTGIVNDGAEDRRLTVRSVLLNLKNRRCGGAKRRVKVPAGGYADAEAVVTVKNARLWSPDSPALYRAVTEIYEDDTLLDRQETLTGIRTVEMSAEKGFLLNGSRAVIRGGLIRAENGFTGAAAHPEAETLRAERLKAAGFNAVRVEGAPPSREFLNACDRVGLMCVADLFDGLKIPKRPMDAAWEFDAYWQRDLSNTVLKLLSHPSVILWCLANNPVEAGGAADGYNRISKMLGLMQTLDSTRPVTISAGAWGGELAGLFSVAACHNPAALEQEAARLPGKAVIGAYLSPEAYEGAVNSPRGSVTGGFLAYAQDYIGGAELSYPQKFTAAGLLDINGLPKTGGGEYIAVRGADDAGFIREWQGEAGGSKAVRVYGGADGDVAALHLNGKMLGRRLIEGGFAEFTVAFEEGALSAHIYSGGAVSGYCSLPGERAAAVKLSTLKKSFKAGESRLVIADITLLGKNKQPVDSFADLSLTVSGGGGLYAFGSAAENEAREDGAAFGRVYSRGSMVIRLSGSPGITVIEATAPGLRKGKLVIKVK